MLDTNLKGFSVVEGAEESTFTTPTDTFSFSGTRVGNYVMIDVESFQIMVKKVEEVEEKVKRFLEEREVLKFRNISDTEARKEITSFVLEMKAKGTYKISILDIVSNLKLPSEQIETIMEDFENKGRINEVYE